MFNLKAIILVVALLYLTQVHSIPVYDDLEGASSDHDYARVQIKVFRGPTEGHDHFAPWGYWVKQPADDHH